MSVSLVGFTGIAIVRLTVKSMQGHQGIIYRGNLESISLNGALVRFGQGIILPSGSNYNLTGYIEGDDDTFGFYLTIPTMHPTIY